MMKQLEMIDLEYWRKYLIAHNNSLKRFAEFGDPWVFICASCLIEYLAKMTIGEKDSYAAFITEYLSKVDGRYSNFKYNTPGSKLPTEMFYVLRNGLVHSFTMKPNQENKGRVNSILLSHKDVHFTHRTDSGFDACIFNAHQFVGDIGKVIDFVFDMAGKDEVLRKRIELRITEYPPLRPV